MSIEISGAFVSILCAAILAFIWFLNRYFENAKQLKELKSKFGNIKNSNAKIIHKIKEEEWCLMQEKEKLLMHTQVSAEGICFFKPDRTVDFYNGLFLQYFNMIAHNSINMEREMLQDAVFIPVVNFLDNRISEEYFETRINNRRGNEFSLFANTFADRSFEIILIDITSREKTRRLKQEMTGNIAHELRTPVTSIRGFLEIILSNNLGEEKKREYLERAYTQTQVLSELIADMSLLTKMDERADSLKISEVYINELLQKIKASSAAALAEKNIQFNVDIPEALYVLGSESLLYSIFRNLTDNVIRHAGENLSINIKTLPEMNDGMLYFLFSDTGKGVGENVPLERLFERFYRVDEGRSRDTGGSGLGLSIVKNAVLFHKGTITVRSGGNVGLEFLFSLKKILTKF
jgi:two-component system OmpR family sensor kinase/two-component system phosphate regulon sensor histidine kinase PhoR